MPNSAISFEIPTKGGISNLKNTINNPITDRLTDPWLERYIEMYIYIVIRGPQGHQSLTGSSIYTLRPSAATYYHNRIYTYVWKIEY